MKTMDLAKSYLAKYPLMPSRTIARMIVDENRDIDGNECLGLNAVRAAVRELRGTIGKYKRKIRGFDLQMPSTDTKAWLPYVVPEEYDNTWIMADTHIPYHDKESIELFVKMAKERKVNSIIIDGDLADFYKLSYFCKDPRKRSFISEVKQVNHFLDYLEDSFPNARIIYKTANHEARLDTYMMQKCAELYGMDGLNLASILEIASRGIILVGDKRVVKYGHLSILHMDELSRGMVSPVNPARGLYLKTHTTSLGAHHHQSSSHTEPDLNGKFTTCWTLGCLSGLHPEWCPINKWNVGSGFATKDKSGNFKFENYKVIQGEVYPA